MLNPSRETGFSGANADREILFFPVQLTTSRVGNHTRLIYTLAMCGTIHTYIHTYEDKLCDLYKKWHRPMSKRFMKSPYSTSRATSIDSDCYRLPTAGVLSNQADKSRPNQF